MIPQASVAVIHLVRARNDPAAFTRFIESYRRHGAGAAHQLVIACKGFPGRPPPNRLLDGIDDLRPVLLRVPDRGFDIGAYRAAAGSVDAELICCMNSYSTLLADDWLAKLVGPLSQLGVGIVGATGSWESHFTSGFGPGWRNALPRHPGSWPRWLGKRAMYLHHRAAYPRSPNPHVRTNAFVIRRSDFLSLAAPCLLTKQAAYRFESGYRSMTRQLAGRGLRPLVVDRKGVVYEIATWPESHTFWAGDQEGLLVADNQTESYRVGTPAFRQTRAAAAWGADPPPRTVLPGTDRP
ncbi:MAG TPA: hypothetical protein VFJ85_17990 [Acidimicrobiales bacterium]|nr:hypothetical protein [Acidimicrobiales bacterium]